MTNTPCDLDEFKKHAGCIESTLMSESFVRAFACDAIRLADELTEARAKDKLASSAINRQIDVNQGLRAELAEARLKVGSESVVLAMTVDRLGGIVEGHPTARLNFLQRVDELREIEHKYRCLPEGDKTKLAEARAEIERQLARIEDYQSACSQRDEIINGQTDENTRLLEALEEINKECEARIATGTGYDVAIHEIARSATEGK